MEIKESLRKLCLEEKNRCPLSQIQDYYKLIFQSVFGAGHLITNPTTTIQYFYDEWDHLEENKTIEWVANITLGTPLVRLNLARCKVEKIPREEIIEAFLEGCKNFISPSPHIFQQILMSSVDILASSSFGFSMTDLHQILPINKKGDYPVMHHSSTYRVLYNPHYRVLPISQIKQKWCCTFPSFGE